MDWKKVLFGSYNYDKTSDDGHEKLSISFKGGWVVALLFWGGLAYLVWRCFF